MSGSERQRWAKLIPRVLKFRGGPSADPREVTP